MLNINEDESTQEEYYFKEKENKTSRNIFHMRSNN